MKTNTIRIPNTTTGKTVLSSKTRRAQARKASGEAFLERRASKARGEAILRARDNATKQIQSVRFAEAHNEEGRAVARTLLKDMQEFDCPPLLGWRREELAAANVPSGVLIGFDHYIACDVMRGGWV